MKVRKATREDAKALYELRLLLCQETNFMLPTAIELASNMDDEIGKLKNLTENQSVLLLVSEDKNDLTGYLLCRRYLSQKLSHVASLVMGTRRASWGSPTASRLFAQMISWANEKSIHRLELTVMSDNQRAVSFYRKLGFLTEGQREKAIYDQDRFFHELYMARISPF